MTTQLKWIHLGALSETNVDFASFSKDVGIYRAILNGEIVYVGKATELHNGGFRKRLRDYTRASDSARRYPAGRLMHQHRHEIDIQILVFDRHLDSLPRIEELEAALIRDFHPKWNALP
jgi:excinuclease UvrABC nuclease subunit